MKTKIPSHILKELWQIRNPHLKIKHDPAYQLMAQKVETQSKKDKPLHTTKLPLPSKKAYFELTTARNRHLITEEEQNKLRQTVVGFWGLSVGSHAALTWMMESRADTIKIIDPDTIDATNLNRLRFGWDDIGKLKIDIVKKQLYQINPFANIISSIKTDSSSITKLFTNPKLDIIVDAIDDFPSKLLLRQLAKKHRIPLVSGADVGDNVMVDVERYDLNPQPQFFHGRIPNVETINFPSLSVMEKKKLIIKLVGFEHNSEKMLDSLMAIGGTIVTWPQLGATATIAGGAVVTLIKKIILGEHVNSGRYYLSLDEIFVSDYNSSSNQQQRQQKITKITDLINK